MNNLVILRNDLKNKKPPRYKVIGITSELILSKKVFENKIQCHHMYGGKKE